ncbi:MAG: cytochrome c-type biogenesis protein CcmH [Beijerinckiaceae bacterium]|nr:cytochrome c-type biogenesis protein CcmH [Beijerinckiaceae bacterium]
MSALRLLRLAVLAAVVSLAPAAAFAVQPGEILADAALEKRARELSAELRCLVCQNQSIDDSSAPLARDLRLVVRERLVAGDSNEQVMTYVVQRYGEFILLRPPFRFGTLLLWLTPLVALSGGLAWMLVAWRRRSRLGAVPATAPLSEDERKALERVLDGR